MPRGRFVSKDVSTDLELNSVSPMAHLLFLQCIPHLDREGRLLGEPGQVKGKVVPLREEYSVGVIENCMGELHDANLVLWYRVDGRRYLWFKGFDKHQKGLRKQREAESEIPSPNHPRTERLDGFASGAPSEVPPGSPPRSMRGPPPGPSEVGTEVPPEVQDSKDPEERGESAPPPDSFRNDSRNLPTEGEGKGEVEVTTRAINLPASSTKPEGRVEIGSVGGTPTRDILAQVCLLGQERVKANGHEIGLGLLLRQFEELVERSGDDPELVKATVAIMRDVHDFGGEPASLKVFLADGRWEFYELCKGAAVKALEGAADPTRSVRKAQMPQEVREEVRTQAVG